MARSTGSEPDAVHDLLGELDTEGTVAALEARVRDLEQELERAEARAFEAERARQGDLEMMRARTQDALELVRQSMEEQRVAFRSFEERFSGLVATAEASGRQHVDQLREDLSPMVQRAVIHSDEVAAELKGELAAIATETAELVEAVAALGDAGDELAGRTEAVAARVAEEREDRAAAVAAVEDRVSQRLATVDEATRYRLLEERGRIEALRRELDAAVGELRAGINLKAGELIERIEDNRIELAERLEHHDRAVVDLEERLGAAVVRRSSELDPLHRSTDELQGRVEALETRLAEAVHALTGSLSNRLSEVAGTVEGLRETTSRHEERLSGVDHLERRIIDMAMRREAVAAPSDDGRIDELAGEVARLRDAGGSTAERLEGIERYLRELTTRLPGAGDALEAGDGLRHEIRDLATRTSELTARLDETDRIARTAGQAITRVIRQGRSTATAAGAPAPQPSEPADDRPDEPGPEGPLFKGH